MLSLLRSVALMVLLGLAAAPLGAASDPGHTGHVHHEADYSAASCTQFLAAGGPPERRTCSFPVRTDAEGRLLIDRHVSPEFTGRWTIRAAFDATFLDRDGNEAVAHVVASWWGVSAVAIHPQIGPPSSTAYIYSGMRIGADVFPFLPHQDLTVTATYLPDPAVPVALDSGFWGVAAHWPDYDWGCRLADTPGILAGDEDCAYYSRSWFYGNVGAARDEFAS